MPFAPVWQAGVKEGLLESISLMPSPVFFVEPLTAIDKVCPRGTAMRLNVEALAARYAGCVGCKADFTVLTAASAGRAVNIAQQVRGLICEATHSKSPCSAMIHRPCTVVPDAARQDGLTR